MIDRVILEINGRRYVVVGNREKGLLVERECDHRLGFYTWDGDLVLDTCEDSSNVISLDWHRKRLAKA